jgi:hypothetical protein
MLQAQQYIKVKKDFMNKDMRFFTDEIYALDSLAGAVKYFTVGDKKYSAKNNVDILPDSLKLCDKTDLKDSIVKIIKNTIHQDSIRIDIRFVKTDENANIRLRNNNSEIRDITDSITVVACSDIDSIFRLIIPRAPVISYNTGELKEYVKTEPAKRAGDTDENKTFLRQLIAIPTEWFYVVGCLILLLAVGGIIWQIYLRKKKETVVFKSKSLKKFAKKYGGINKLHNLNPDIIPEEAKWDSFNVNQQDLEIKKLQGQLIRVKEPLSPSKDISEKTPDEQSPKPLPQKTSQKVFENNISFNEFVKQYGGMNKLHELNPDIIPSRQTWNMMNGKKRTQKINSIKGKTLTVPFETDEKEKVETVAPYLDSGVDIPAQLRNMQKTIIDEINKIKNAESQVEKEKLEKLIQEKEKFEILVKEKETKINQLDSENKKLQTMYDSLCEKVSPVEFLRNYAETVDTYFNLCAEVERKISSYYDRAVHRNSSDVATIACLLQKFRNSICNIPAGNWQQIINDIKDTGITANRQVIRILSQPSTDREKQREFRKTLFREVIVPYSSSILILAESFRNSDRFSIDGDDTAVDMKRYVDNIVNKAKTIDLEIKYVPLFEKFDNYSAKVESVNRSRSFPYSGISNLQRDDIAEIISYGVSTEFEDTKTQIIII